MPFLRSLNKTAPGYDRNLPWPIDGLAYVVAWTGPICAGPIIGLQARDWSAFAIGSLAGIGITFLNVWLSDKFVHPWIARFQKTLLKVIPRVLANIVAFAWAIFLCALSMITPVAVLGSEILARIH